MAAKRILKELKDLQKDPTSFRADHVGMSKSYMEGVSYPTTPDWDTERPFLTGQIYLDIKVTGHRMGSKSSSIDTFKNGDVNRAIGIFTPSVQELLVIDDLLFAMTGIEGMYISMKRGRAKDSGIVFQVDASMDLALQELAKRILPLCENYMVINSFVESRSHFKHGLVNHAFAATLRTILQDYHAMVAQLEHQFRLGRLSLQGLWFFCQPMMGAIQALTTVVQKASAQNLSGSAILNLLQNQAAAMAGDNAARSLLEKLSQYASAAYLGILERWVYEGVIDDPYGEFFIAEDKTLQKESLTEDCNAKYWQQRYSLKPGIPSFLLNSAETILTTGKYLNVLRECGHSVQVPFSENAKLTNSGSDHRYLECINIAYNFASAELLNLITHKYDLMARLRSMKHYFLLDQGDFLVHFMDIARDELAKKPAAISVEKLQSMIDAVAICGPGFKAPTEAELSGYLLDEMVEDMRVDLEENRKDWIAKGCTIMTDGWTDRRNRTLLNFLVSCGGYTMFIKSIDASAHVKNATYLCEAIEEVIAEVGEENVIQVVTDNAANYVAAGKLLMERHPTIFWSPCAAHCIDLMLEEIGKLEFVKSCVERAKNICKFIYNHAFVLSTMRKYTGGKELARPGITRFASNFITLQSLLTSRDGLRSMFVGQDWICSSYSTTTVGLDVADCIFDEDGFWKPAREILKSLLDLALRTSIAATDPFHEDLTCCVERTSLLVQLDAMKKMGNGMSDLNTEAESLEGDKSNSDISNQSDSISITGLETFSLDYKVQWPLSLILSKKVLTKYQLIFRLLFHCKHVQRELCGTWQAHQGTRGVKSLGTTISGSYVLCQNMLHFMQSLVHYLTFEVLEPNWHVMCDKLQNTESIDEVMQQHDFFLSKCQKECLLLWPEILQKVEKLKSICLQYAAAIHWLIPSVSVLDSDASKINSSESGVRKEILNKTTNRIRSRHRPLANPVWRSSDEETFKTTLEKFEDEFTEQMKGLIIALSSRSQSEPYLAHLAQGLQGLGNNL